jgi:hypothetical protein
VNSGCIDKSSGDCRRTPGIGTIRAATEPYVAAWDRRHFDLTNTMHVGQLASIPLVDCTLAASRIGPDKRSRVPALRPVQNSWTLADFAVTDLAIETLTRTGPEVGSKRDAPQTHWQSLSGDSYVFKSAPQAARALTMREGGALSDLDKITVRIADVAANLAVLFLRLGDELGSSTFP